MSEFRSQQGASTEQSAGPSPLRATPGGHRDLIDQLGRRPLRAAAEQAGPLASGDRAVRAVAPPARARPQRGSSGDPLADLRELRRRQGAVGLDGDAPALRDMRARERIYRRSLVCADAFAATSAAMLAIGVLGGYGLRLPYLLVAPLIVVVAKISGLYDKDELVIDHSTLNELPRLLNLATMFALVLWLGRHYVVIGTPPTVDLLALWLLLSAALLVARTGARVLARRLAPVERCLLIGRPSVFERLGEKFRAYPRVSLVGIAKTDEIAHDHLRLREFAEQLHIHRIIIDTDDTSSATTLEIIRAANATGLQVSLLPSMLGAVGGSVVFDDVGGLMLMGVPRFGLSRSSLALKRSFDVVGASAALILAGPLMAVVAAAIRLDSTGSVLFRQTRVGRDGTPFEMLKFRSMVDGADALKDSLREHNESDGLFKIRADPRITRVGRLLRRTGVDELPQLFNVLAGDMSLVGPRPLVLEEDTRVTGFDRRRLHLTPGITGRWQTLGSARVPLSEMVKIDYLYIANWSLWIDFKIVLETIAYIARGRGQ